MALHDTPWHSTALHDTPWHSTTPHSTTPHGTPQHSMARHNTPWQANVQLASWSVLAYSILAFYGNTRDPFHGWSFITCCVAAVGATGGILVALCLRYTDAVLKNFPTAVSVVLVTGGSALMLNGPTTFPTGVGAFLVAVSIFNYAEPDVEHVQPDHLQPVVNLRRQPQP